MNWIWSKYRLSQSCFCLDSNFQTKIELIELYFRTSEPATSNSVTTFWRVLGELYRSETLWGSMDPWWGLEIKFSGRMGLPILPFWTLKCLFLEFFSLWRPATSVKINGYLWWLKRFFLMDELYWLVPQSTSLDFYFLRYGPLTGTRWWYDDMEWRFFRKQKIFVSLFDPEKMIPTKKGPTFNFCAIWTSKVE
jgi:hypothetical protein